MSTPLNKLRHKTPRLCRLCGEWSGHYELCEACESIEDYARYNSECLAHHRQLRDCDECHDTMVWGNTPTEVSALLDSWCVKHRIPLKECDECLFWGDT